MLHLLLLLLLLLLLPLLLQVEYAGVLGILMACRAKGARE